MLLSLFAFYNRFLVGVIVFWLHPFLSNRFLWVQYIICYIDLKTGFFLFIYNVAYNTLFMKLFV